MPLGGGPHPLVVVVPERVPVGEHQPGDRHQRDEPEPQLDDLDDQAELLPARQRRAIRVHGSGHGNSARTRKVVGRHDFCSPHRNGRDPSGKSATSAIEKDSVTIRWSRRIADFSRAGGARSKRESAAKRRASVREMSQISRRSVRRYSRDAGGLAVGRMNRAIKTEVGVWTLRATHSPRSWTGRPSEPRDCCREAGESGSLERHSQGRVGAVRLPPGGKPAIDRALVCGFEKVRVAIQQPAGQTLLRQQERVTARGPLEIVDADASPMSESIPTIAVRTIQVSRKWWRKAFMSFAGRNYPN